ncbi:Permease of the drug/metabolite transporter (DMT) superfamily [Halalkaliarchaeum sp. AArc-CO]|uniref:DMT family transporter n=1 Tax=unclassified Halalkaliarchaeum TaxID=2678344 RepID=UPI00217D07CC|nr:MULTISPECIES: DMT family transporter [unclassified Halalkaliarchaeum]MDR5671716.1 DMT family transporter [Halalkaliarchaeum sp. AArc-GB]UWG51211.1 Permease of the drug/metabolite transporter (DMT) superfamily [Halalkaliarchaeum sp. AArc-CO]
MTSPFRNAILFVVLAAVWGSAFTAIKAGLEFFPPVLFAAFRYDLAGLLMLGYAVYATDRWRPRSRDEWLLVGTGGAFLIAAYHAFLFVGQQGTTSAAAAVIVSLSPILTTGFARALLPDERLAILGVVGLLVGFVGVVILSNPDPNNLLDARTVSMLLIFLAAASFALGSVLTRRFDTGLPIETMEAWSMLVGALLMHGVSVALAESVADVEWTLEALVALLYLVVVASAAGFLIYFDLLERLGPIEINLVSYAAPVAAAVTGLVFLGEVPTIHTWVGFLFILTGFLLVKRDAIRAELVRL